jgi:hypothetical protein
MRKRARYEMSMRRTGMRILKGLKYSFEIAVGSFPVKMKIDTPGRFFIKFFIITFYGNL